MLSPICTCWEKRNVQSHIIARYRTAIVSLFFLIQLCIRASCQTDEIQVYDAEINKPGQFSLQLHSNYTPIGRKEADFKGGVVPNHSLNGVPEWAYGVTDWFEAGLYLPLYTVTHERRFMINGFKLRTLFVSPHAEDRTFFYGVNFELSYNARHWEKTRFSGEIRPIIGYRIGRVDLIINPIIDTSFNGIGHLDLAPAERIAYNFSKTWAIAVEHYSDYGQFNGFESANQQSHTGFLVIDYKGDPNSVEFGVGHGFTSASDSLVLKMILSHSF
jgi:hypothetical protein